MFVWTNLDSELLELGRRVVNRTRFDWPNSDWFTLASMKSLFCQEFVGSEVDSEILDMGRCLWPAKWTRKALTWEEAESLMALVSCACKSGCATRKCSCLQHGLSCTEGCKCSDSYQNNNDITRENDTDDKNDEQDEPDEID